MKNKGFTLVELLAVLIILAIIFVISVPLMTEILDQSKNTLYKKQINTILDATYDYSLKYIEYLPEDNNISYITLGELKYEGIVDYDLTDPETNERFKNELVISINKVGTGYKNSDIHAKLKGDYLYIVEVDKLKEAKNLKPIITLDGLTKNTDGNYILTLDLNQEINNIAYSAISANGVDLTKKVKKYILLNDIPTDNITTTNSGIYKVHYTVVDNNGYANTATLSIIIADTTIPTITLPNTNKIGKDVTNFDLLKNVTCEDNSGYCDIEFSGEIDYGVVGKYIITYTAKDPSGNTSIKKRVITIE
ncbi:MAG: DUF5011 domain-containing protein [Bacilli bacterium]|nr:DUF5011 domain-containing protein [Bacilli bacterium]